MLSLVINISDVIRVSFSDAHELSDPNISRWDVTQVRDLHDMFNGASSFDHDISGWILPENPTTTNMFLNADAFNAKFTCTGGVDGPPSTCSPK